MDTYITSCQNDHCNQDTGSEEDQSKFEIKVYNSIVGIHKTSWANL
jgi:hypothetical protein